MQVRSVVRLIRVCGKLTSTWPPEPGTSTREAILRESLWLVSLLNVIGLLVPLMMAVYQYRLELGPVMKSLSELTALSEVFFNLIICRIQRRRLHELLSEVTDYVENADTGQRLVLQKYSDRYLPFLLCVGSSYFMTAVVFSCGPLIIANSLPADAWYPFSVESLATRCSLYVLQVLAILQTGLCISVDFMVSMMLWYPTARIDMLVRRIKIADSAAQLDSCIEEHQRVIAFVRKTCHAVRLIILKGNATMAIVVICGGFPLIHVSSLIVNHILLRIGWKWWAIFPTFTLPGFWFNDTPNQKQHEPFVVVSQFILMVAGGLLRLYVSAWPADDLAEISEDVALSTYCSPWIDGSPRMRRNVLFVIQRSRKPLVISVRGILPALTLRFYASFVSSTLSYFMTVRAIFGE